MQENIIALENKESLINELFEDQKKEEKLYDSKSQGFIKYLEIQKRLMQVKHTLNDIIMQILKENFFQADALVYQSNIVLKSFNFLDSI